MSVEKESIIRVEGIKKYFPVKSGVIRKTTGYIKAVDGLSFEIIKGETLGLVGESGSGKSTTGRTIINLLKATKGDVYYKGKNITRTSKRETRILRKDIQIIFQDPYGSLNPRMTVGEIVGEALKEHGLYKGKQLEQKVLETLEICGLSPFHFKRYPHEFSGGQRQRIGIARALALNPEFIVCDEIASALDVSIQSQIINLLKSLQKSMDLTYLFISHDLSIVRYISDRIAVMYLGTIVELTNNHELFERPMHPYTKALLSSIPPSHPKDRKEKIILKGDVPSAANPPSGCKFRTRCYLAKELCSQEVPVLEDIGDKHFVACHFIHDI